MTSKKNTSSAPAGQQRSLRSLGGHGWRPRVLALTLATLFAPVGGFAQDSTAVEETATLPRISVVGTSGTDEVRQAQRRVQVGPLGERDSVATPYSVSAVSAEQMADDQNFSVQDALRYLPWVQADTIRPQTRGVQGSVIQNSRVDGFNMVSTTNYPTEQFERIEVLNGVAGSLYGPATGSGVFGFTQKRAGTTGTNTLRLGIDSDARPSIHADLWTPLTADKRWRVRANLLQETGDSYAEGSHRRRTFGGVALDADLTPDTQWQVNASHYRFIRRGEAGSFGVAANVPFPATVDPKRVGYGQPYSGNDNETSTITTRVLHRFDSGWQLTAGLSRQIADRESTSVSNTLRSAAGNYVTTSSSTTASRFTVTGNQLSLNGKVQAGGMQHDITVANNGFDWNNYNPRAGRSITLGQASLAAPVRYAEPDWPDFRQRYQSAAQRQQSLVLADTVDLDPNWQVMLSASYSWMKLTNYNRAGATTRSSSDHGLSPFASVMYRFDPVNSVYLSYGDTLQPGDAAPTGTANEGEVLDPYRSKQWELGYKTRLHTFDANVALFRIERPFAYTDSETLLNNLPVYREAGKQRNRGFEGSISGNVTQDLSMTAMVSWLDPRMVASANAASRNKKIVGLSSWTASLTGDMRIRAVSGLSINARFITMNRRAANYANTDWIGGYGRLDVGARWEQQLWGHDTTWRLTVYNLTNQRYWTNIVAGGLNGYSGNGNATADVGDPRSAMLTVQFAL